MKSSKLILVCFPIATWACGTSSPSPSQMSPGNDAGSSSSGNGGSSSSGGDMSSSSSSSSGSGSGSGADGGESNEAGGSSSGSGRDASGSSSGAEGGIVFFDGGVNMIPAGYTGTPFDPAMPNRIPGFLFVANYDKGGPGVGFCHTAAGMGAACATGINLKDWCCSDANAMMTGARCDDRSQAMGVCPVYRPDADNAGLSHMNLGEVDTFGAAGPTWVDGPNGPTLTGPMAKVGDPVPQHANATTEEDTYLSYTAAGEWQKYTVQVLSPGVYSIGTLMGTPAGSTATLDFGGGVTSGPIALPVSPVSAACKCAEAFHSWTNTANIGKVTFATAGTYLLTLTLTAGRYNPLFFTFTKM